MDRALHEFERARSRMAGDLKTMLADSEALLKATASVSGEGLAAARAQVEGSLQRARASLADASQPVLARTRRAAAYAGDTVRDHPWTALGLALAAGALIGLLAARR